MNRRKFITMASAATGASLLSGTAVAADDTAADTLPAQVRHTLDQALAAGSPSAVCGVIRGGRTYVAGAAGKGKRTPDGRTVFQLGSIGKTLTATALALAVGAGETRLDAPLTLPARFPIPRQGPRRITLADLATHSSGLPRLPRGVLDATNPYDPYAHYTLDDLAADLGETTLAHAPGEKYAYSNLGFGLLGQALAFDRVDEMLRHRVAAPLGMTDTTTTLRPDMLLRKSLGHMQGQLVPDWRDSVLSAAGTSLYSTANDMLRFLAAQLRPERSPLRDAIELTQRPRFDAAEGLRIGLAWNLSPLSGGRTMTWHNGSTGGFSTCAAFDRERGTAVVVMVNTWSQETETKPRPVDALTIDLLRELDAAAPA